MSGPRLQGAAVRKPLRVHDVAALETPEEDVHTAASRIIDRLLPLAPADRRLVWDTVGMFLFGWRRRGGEDG